MTVLMGQMLRNLLARSDPAISGGEWRAHSLHLGPVHFGMDEGVDGGLFAWADGAAGGLVFAGEVLEGFGGFADEEGLGVNTGFEGVLRGGGFPGVSDGSGGPLRIGAIRFDLSLRGHDGSEIARRHGGSGGMGGKSLKGWDDLRKISEMDCSGRSEAVA